MTQADAIAQRLAGGDADLAASLTVVPGVEVRAPGNLLLDADWDLRPGAGPQEVSAPPILTLRAAGTLNIARTLSDGFAAPAGSSGGGSQTTANRIAQPGPAASFRLVGGADLSAADPRTVTPSATGGDVLIGRPATTPSGVAPDVFVRSTTGDISVSAGRDVRLLTATTRLYTTGNPVDSDDLPQWARVGLNQANQTLRDGGRAVGPFFVGAGDIRLDAARDLAGSPTRQYVTDWWWRQATPASADKPVAVWSRYDLFAQGVASFGGGAIDARAGRDVIDLEASTPASAYAVAANAGQPAATQTWAGGALRVEAGRDVVSGLLYAGGAVGSVSAGNAVRPAEVTGLGRSHPGLQLLHGDTAVTVTARSDLTVGQVANPGHVSGVLQGSGFARGDVVAGLAEDASLSLQSTSGDLRLAGTRTPLTSTDPRQNDNRDIVRQAPGRVVLTAPDGSVTVSGPLLQRPAGDGVLQVLAADSVNLARVQVNAAPAPLAQPEPQTRLAADNTLAREWRSTGGNAPALDGGSRDPVRFVAEDGDITYSASLVSARPLRLLAGGDVAGRGSAGVDVQHQVAGELTLVQAGRDIVLADNTSARLRVAGPGELVLLAGRDIDLKSAAGIATLGNQENPRLLPEGGAQVTLVSGIDWAGADYRQALADGFQLRGSAIGVVPFIAEMTVLVEALAAGQPAPAAGSEAVTAGATAFRALDPATQAARLESLLGSAALDAARAAVMRRQLGQPDLDDAAALAARASLDALRRAEVDTRAQALALTERAGRPDALAFTGQLLAGLAPERQVLVVHDVLFDELRSAGRTAAPLPSGPDREAAYQPGYDAITAVFPGARPGGEVRLATSQIRTDQDGSIRILAPGGGIEAGSITGAGGKRATDLGILTVAGGNIEAAARDDFAVNQSRVFTLQRGDLLLWSSDGNVDAGRGAKTATSAPAPVFTIDRDGNVVVDTSGSFSGSGIAVLDAASALDLYAPKGEINAGEAGIVSRGTAFLGGNVVVGDDISVAVGTGAPPPPPTSSGTAGLSALSQTAASAGAPGAADAAEEEERRNRRPRRNLLLDFLGFGAGD